LPRCKSLLFIYPPLTFEQAYNQSDLSAGNAPHFTALHRTHAEVIYPRAAPMVSVSHFSLPPAALADCRHNPRGSIRPSANMQTPAHSVLLPVAANFDRLLRVRVRQFVHGNIYNEKIDDKVVIVRCGKPAQPRPPSAEDWHRLAPYERAFKEVLEAQQRRGFDAEGLDKAFAPLLKEVGDMQGIRAHTVDLSCNVLGKLSGRKDKFVALVEVPGDL